MLELEGRILLLCVDHDANTTIHLAELTAGVRYRRPKHITVAGKKGPQRIDYLENDHCCQRFNLVNEWLDSKQLQRRGKVGNASAKLMNAKDLLSVVVTELFKNPMIFLHPRSAGCAQCDEARDSLD